MADRAGESQPSALQRFQSKLSEHGYDVDVKDLPMAIAIHEGLGFGLFVSTFGACYAIQPSKRLSSTTWAQRVKKELDDRARRREKLQESSTSVTSGFRKWVSAKYNAVRISASKYLSPRAIVALVSLLCVVARASPSSHTRLPVALEWCVLQGEQAVVRQVVRPQTIVLKLWLTLEAVAFIKDRKHPPL